jgi:hypothetical protein
VISSVVYPGSQPTTAWAWVVIGLWFGALPLVMLTIAAVYRITGKEAEQDEQED